VPRPEDGQNNDGSDQRSVAGVVPRRQVNRRHLRYDGDESVDVYMVSAQPESHLNLTNTREDCEIARSVADGNKLAWEVTAKTSSTGEIDIFDIKAYGKVRPM